MPLYEATPLEPMDLKCGFSRAEHYGDLLGPAAFGHDSGMCEMRHLCGDHSDLFTSCMEAVDCHMTRSMRVTHSSSPVVTFMRQMIPHHQNAVNMARTLLKTAADEIDAEDAKLDEPFIRGLMLAIVNEQNMQIMQMFDYLKHLDENNEVRQGLSPQAVIHQQANWWLDIARVSLRDCMGCLAYHCLRHF